ncbi:MAG: ABC transporter ATP-binding protein [Acidobacteriota bacterium]
MLEARALTKRYPGLTAVRNVSFTLRQSQILGYLGPNGSGKSTTVKMLIGLVEPSSGVVLFNGQPIAADLVGFRRRLAYVPEEPHVYPFLSGREYLQLVGRLRGLRPKRLDEKADALLSLFGLRDSAEQSIGGYSKGMRQKVLIIAALLHDPDLLIFDEPLSGLDVTTAVIFRHLVRTLADRGKAILYSSHVLESVEKLCSSVIVLYKGSVVADDSIHRLRTLMSRSSLEEVFAELVFQEDPVRIATEMADVVTTPL